MKCNKCGYECETDFLYCPGCGANVNAANETFGREQWQPDPNNTTINPALFRLSAMFKDKLFLAICVLVSVSAGCCLFTLNWVGIIFSTLFTIFLWLIYAQNKNNIVDARYMQCISGTVFAQYVVNWVSVGSLAFTGFVAMIFSSTVYGNGFFKMLFSFLDDYSDDFDELYDIFALGAQFIGIVIGFFCILIAAVVAIINIFGIGSIHKFSKSLYISAQSGNFSIIKRQTAQVWMMVFGIMNGISALFSISDNVFSFLESGCLCATYIVAYLLIKKYFFDCNI